MKFKVSRLLSDPFGFYLPIREKKMSLPIESTASFSENTLSLDKVFWSKRDELVKLKMDGVKEKNEMRNFLLSTQDQYYFALYIAMAAFLGGLFSNQLGEDSVNPTLMYFLGICFFVGVTATMIRIRIETERADIAADYERMGVIYFLAKDESKAQDCFNKALTDSLILSKSVIIFANVLTNLISLTLIIGVILMAILSFNLIRNNQEKHDDKYLEHIEKSYYYFDL